MGAIMDRRFSAKMNLDKKPLQKKTSNPEDSG
jgi:hypothetical protein